jgi:hypothetical protein
MLSNLKQWFFNSAPTPNPRLPKKTLRLEALEPREVRAITGVWLDGVGVIQIRSDNGGSGVEVNTVSSQIHVQDTGPTNGFSLTAPIWRFTATKVNSIKFVGGDGPDKVVVNSTRPLEAWGNGGKDYLEGANAADTLLGGDGDDTLKGYGGNDRLYGGDGVDLLYGHDGHDALYGGGPTSADQLWGGTGKDRFLTQSGDIIRDGNGINSLTGEDVQIRFADTSSASWSNTEIRVLDDALQRLFDATGNNRLLRDSVSVESLTITQEDITALGTNTSAYQKREVTYSGPWWNQTEHVNLRTVARKIVIDEWNEDSDSTNNLMRDTLIHEFGHTWDTEHSNWNNWLKLSGWRDTPPPTADAAKYSKSTDGQWWYLKTATFVRDYGRTNPREEFASSWESYFVQRFKTPNSFGVGTLSTAKYNHIDNLFRSLR